MFQIIFFIIIVGVIVSAAKKNQGQQNRQGNGRTMSGHTPVQGRPQMTGGQNLNGRPQEYNRAQTQRTAPQTVYGRQQAAQQKKPQDILGRAMSNVRDAVRHEDHNPAFDQDNCDSVGRIFDSAQPVQGQSRNQKQSGNRSVQNGNQSGANVPQTEFFEDGTKLMDEIQDLIVCGYDGKLTYSRDFVAEGMDMLERMI